MFSSRIFTTFTITLLIAISSVAKADTVNGPTDYTFNKYIGDTWVSRVTAQYSTINKNVCLGYDLGTCTSWGKKPVQALFLKIVANAPSCANRHHLAGYIKAKFTTSRGGVAYAQVNLTANNEGGYIDEWRNIEGYYGPLAGANVNVEVSSRCDRNNRW